MARKKKPEEKPAGCPEWMATYGDMVTLLLCFFVLMFSMSSVDAQKFEALASALSGGSGILNSQGSNIQTPVQPRNGQQAFDSLEKDLNKYLSQQNLNEDISVLNEPRGLVLRFKDNVLFDSGSANLKSQSLDTLKYLGELLNKEEIKDNNISVEGHTDNDPIRRNPIYPSNWELSTARASNVVQYLIENANISPDRLSASGYSEYHPIAPNDTPENKAKNRRVDIVILKNDKGE